MFYLQEPTLSFVTRILDIHSENEMKHALTGGPSKILKNHPYTPKAF